MPTTHRRRDRARHAVAADNTILPGMTVDADIRTGERTVLQYLLKPIFNSISDAFKES